MMKTKMMEMKRTEMKRTMMMTKGQILKMMMMILIRYYQRWLYNHFDAAGFSNCCYNYAIMCDGEHVTVLMWLSVTSSHQFKKALMCHKQFDKRKICLTLK